LFVFGAAYGAIFDSLGQISATNKTMAQVLNTSGGTHQIALNFMGLLSVMFAVAATIPALLLIFKLKTDETKGYLEQVNARAVSRLRLFSSYFGLALLFATLVFAAGLYSVYVAESVTMKAPLAWSLFVTSFWGYLPAIYATLGIGALLVGLLPRLTNLSWLLLYYAFFTLYFGGLFDLPKWRLKLTPFGLVPALPTHDIDLTIVFTLLAIFVFLVGADYYSYRHRDLKIG
jgi:ABC-2 type transport system permease protein